MKRRIGTLLLPFTLILGCSAEAPAPAESTQGVRLTPGAGALLDRTRTSDEYDYIFYADDTMKPAYKSVEHEALKADYYSDVRAASPERFAITEPPSATYRPMVEWEPMQAVMLSVPDHLADYSNAGQTILQIAYHASKVAEVWIIVPSSATANKLRQNLYAMGMGSSALDDKVRFLVEPLDSVWFIDFGPLPIINKADGTFAFTDFRYYHQRPQDDGLSTFIGRSLGELGMGGLVDTYRMPVSTEGGNFQATSDGICFTSNRQLYYMSCEKGWCDSSIRTKPLSQIQHHPLAQELRAQWAAYAGCKDTVIVNAITDDGTGHIDMFMKVVDDQTVLMGYYPKPYRNYAQQENAARMEANAAFLESYVKPNGTTFSVPRLVMPGHRSSNSGSVPFTYINSTFINGLNLWPATKYSDWTASRNQAEATWEAVMPGYEHVWIDSTELSFWSGAIHCITRTIPARQPGQWVGEGTCGSNNWCQAPLDGYDGPCYPTGYTPDVCYGPDWECACNDCGSCGDYGPAPSGSGSDEPSSGGSDSAGSGSGSGSDEPSSGGSTSDDPCQGISWEGCCEGGALYYCDGGQLKGGACGGSCGWNSSQGWYDCGYSGSDPTDTHPQSCSTIIVTEGDDGGSDPGTTPPSTGSGSTGSDSGADTSGTGSADPVDSTTTPSEPEPTDSCQGITWQGCCTSSGLLAWCEGGELKGGQCSGSCGWNPSQGWYDCGYTGEDPSGQHPGSCN